MICGMCNLILRNGEEQRTIFKTEMATFTQFGSRMASKTLNWFVECLVRDL